MLLIWWFKCFFSFFVLDLVKCSVARLLSTCHKQWPIFSVLWWNVTGWRRPVPKEASGNLMWGFHWFFFPVCQWNHIVRFVSVSTWTCCRHDEWVNRGGKFCANNFHVIPGLAHKVALLELNIVILLWETTRASLTAHHFSAFLTTAHCW